MKKVIGAIAFLGALALVGIVDAADPASPISQTSELANPAGFTISKPLSDSGFIVVDSLIDVCSDTGVFVLMVSGCVVMEQNQTVYIGFGNDSANRVDSATGATTGIAFSNLDTLTIKSPDNMEGSMTIPFFFYETVNTLVALTDTFYLNAATGSASYTVTLQDVKFTCDIH